MVILSTWFMNDPYVYPKRHYIHVIMTQKIIFVEDPVTLREEIIELDNVWEADQLPEYARTHIVPRKLKKDSVEARKKKVLAPVGEDAPLGSDGIPDKKLEAFKFSMLKTSLEHEPSNILARGWVSKKSDEDAEGVETAKTLKTLNYVRKAIEKWKEKVDQNKAKRGEPRTFSKKSSKSSRSPKKSRYF